MTKWERLRYEQIHNVVEFLKHSKMSAFDLAKITKELCACGTCKFFVQHYTKNGDALDWGHCCKGNIQHSKKISTASCGFWDCDNEEVYEDADCD